MSDRFKFRAWHDGRMIYEQFCEYLGSYGCSFAHFDKLKHPLMQSTGLRDKNGKLIFEGDILRAYGIDFLGVVKQTDNKDYHGLWVCNKELEEEPIAELGECEVVGNIYEQPELLECAE